MARAECPACGQPLRRRRRLCATEGCGHPETSHEINAKGERTFCCRYSGPRGTRCPCRKFEFRES